MLVFRTGIHIVLVRIVNREDPDQQSDHGQHCLSWPFWIVTSFQNFRTFTIFLKIVISCIIVSA